MFSKNKVLLFTDTAEVRYVDGTAIDKIACELIKNEKDIVPVVRYVRDKKKNCFNKSIDVSIFEVLPLFTHFRFYAAALHGMDILDGLKSDYNLHLDFVPSIKGIVRAIVFWTNYLRKIKPERIYVNCYYDSLKMAMTYAAKTMGIKVIEFQHGVLSHQHFAYNAFAKIVPNPYPDYLLSFGDNFKNMVSQAIYEPESIKVVGSYYLDLVKSRLEINKKLFKEKYGMEKRTIITVASQVTIDKRLMEFYMRFAKSHKDFFVIFVPRFSEPHHSVSLPENFVIETELDIYQCMQNASIVSTGYSTCCLEALALGKPVLCVDIDNLSVQGLKDFLVPETTLRMCNEDTDPIGIIEELAKISEESIICEGNKYFATGHNILLQKALEEIIGEKKC